MNATAAVPVTEIGQVGEPRRVVQRLAERLQFSTERAGRAALIVSELATNLAKHAVGGELLLCPVIDPDGKACGIDVLSLDRGPGITDEAESRRDGHSTAGSLGHGLGAVERLADSMDLYTHAKGTAIAARLWRERPEPPRVDSRFEIGVAHVSKPGEDVCGDGWAWRARQARLAIFVADGLGHGLLAHEAAEAAVRTFDRSHESAPGDLIVEIHHALRPTRGAAVASLAIDLEREIARFAGLGNISGVILLPGGGRQHMVSHNGTAGHAMPPRAREFSYPVPRGSMLLLFSDGMSSHWNLDVYPGLRTRSAAVIAGVLYRDFSRRRDDVTIIVAKERRGDSAKL
jgi:anti-sigma regulatory factor (Ser/Thr protein kinase)